MAFFSLFKKKNENTEKNINENINEKIDIKDIKEEKKEKESFFKKLKQGLKKTSEKFSSSFSEILLGKKVIDEDLIDDIETNLLLADIGVDATYKIMDDIRLRVERNELQTPESLKNLLKQKLQEIIKDCSIPLSIDENKKPYIIFVIGVNGAGKTTTIGKLAKKIQNEGKSVVLAAGDTFRAAAVEQLEVWGKRNNVKVVSHKTGSDSASVAFDALKYAKNKNTDVLIIDTAGRLHNKVNLMQELSKIIKVMKKLDIDAPHETMLVLDASIGQNALMQVQEFNKIVKITGLTLTKMDGTAKGGIIFAISHKFNIPIRFIGVGEKVDDLRVFDSKDFINAIFD